MKRILTIIAIAFLTLGTLFAQERIIFYNGANPIHSQLIENVDSVSFVNNISIVHNNIGETNFQFPVVGIDSIVFSDEEVQVDTGDIIYITYNGNSASIINPWADRGVTVTANGADVTVMAASGTPNIIYYLSGTTSDGSLFIQSDRRLNLILHGVSITNPTGAAIKIIDDVKISAQLEGTSTLVDGGDTTTHKATFDSEGQIEFSGNGTLNVSGNVKHGIYSNDYIRILSGNIKVNNAVADGLHGDYFQMYTGSVEIDNAKTGIDGNRGFIEINGGTIDIDVAAADGKGMTCDSTVLIANGNVTMSLTGAQCKGVKAGMSIALNGGTVTMTGSGATVVTANNPSHCAGLKSNGNVSINGGSLNVTLSNGAAGGKCINADGNVIVNNGTVILSVAGAGGTYTNTSNQSDTYSASCIKSNGDIEVNNLTGNTVMQLTASGTDSKGFSTDGNVTINGGTLTFIASGVESKGISADNTITVNDGDITMTVSGQASKGIKSDIAVIIEGGDLTANVSGATVVANQSASNSIAIKSGGTMEINGGVINATCTSASGGAKCLSSDGNMTFNGGTITLSTAGMGATLVGSGTSCTDGYAASCIKSDGNIVINGGTINGQSTGKGGRGIVCGGTLTVGMAGADNELIHIYVMTSGAPVNASSGGFPGPGGSSSNYWKGLPKGIKVQGNIYINSGHVQSYCAQTSGDPTGEAIETKMAFNMTGGFVEANSYDDAINSQTGFTVSGGYIWAYARGNDGIDNNGTSTAQATNLTGGVIIAAGTEEAIDANIDRGGSFYINGATVIGFYVGNNGMGIFDNPTYLNGQKRLQPTLTANQTYCIKNSGGDPVMIYNYQKTVSGSGFQSSTEGLRPPGGGGSSASFIFTSPEVTSGTYTLYTNPTINGTVNWHGLYIGASATTSGSGTSITAQ